MSGTVSVVTGGQFGSEAKGAVAGYLASAEQNSTPVVCVRVGGPNAGHTVYGRCPRGCEEESHPSGEAAHPWRLRQVPVAAVTNERAKLLIAAGSEVDFNVLAYEVDMLRSAGYEVSDRLFVDVSATVLTKDHIEHEQQGSNLNARCGSTAKGIGAARSARIWRMADTVGQLVNELGPNDADLIQTNLARSTGFLKANLVRGAHVVIEGTQGYGLGLHTEYYPQCTSGDARAIDFLAQAGLSPWANYIEDIEVWVVARTRPIRVAGNSGPLAGETSWDALGIPAERTTVTQNVRRVGSWDSALVRDAVAANGGDDNPRVKLALTMVDYEIPGVRGVTDWDKLGESVQDALRGLINEVSHAVGARVELVGTSPTSIIDLR